MRKVLVLTEATYLNTGYAADGREILAGLQKTGKYDIAEFSIYGTPDDPRRKTIPWKNYANAPSDNDAEEIKNAYHSNPINQFGSWRFERVCLDFKPDVVCFPEGSIVMTSFGYKNIEDIKIGDLVLTHKNRFRPVTKVMERPYFGELTQLQVSGINDSVELTPEHPVLVYKQLRQTNQKKSASKIYEGIEPEFVPAGEVRVGDLAILPTFGHTETKIDIGDYVDLIDLNKNTKIINTLIDVDYDFGVLCGYILSDGYCGSKGAVKITLGTHEVEFGQEILNIYKKIFNIEGMKKPYKGKECFDVNIFSTILQKFFKKFLNSGTHTNIIPECFILGSEEAKKGLLRGLVRGDGCYKKNTINFTTVNEKLAYTYKSVLSSIGICSTVSKKSAVGYGTSTSYDVNCYGEDARKLHEIVQKHDCVNTPKPGVRNTSQNKYFTDKKHIVMKVLGKSHREYRGYVYNIEVEEDNSYVSKICIHNCDIRDFWMCSFAKQSPYREMFNWIYKSTIDAVPQNSEWINTFASADKFLTISEWANDVIKEQSDQSNLLGTATICAPRSFKPVSKTPHRISMGLNPDWKIIGTVMRNQRRKLYPELFEAFGAYLKETGDTQTYLYCHTSYPDNGWDIPQLLVKEEISSRVLFSYTCPCGQLTIAPFADSLQQCRNCKNFSAKPANVTAGASIEQLEKIYQCFDLYIQCANSEGLGIGVVEAAACGIPVMAVDYSAMSETSRKCGGFPIPVQSYNLELETGCYRAKPDVKAIVDYWRHFFRLSEFEREELSLHTLASYKANYNWDRVVKVWEDAIDATEPKNWNIPPRLVQPPPEVPKGLTNKQFIDWAVQSYLPYSNLRDSFEIMCILRDLNFGAFKNNPCGYFYSENSYFDRVNFSAFGRDHVLNLFKQKSEAFNFWEKARVGQIQFKKESWLADNM